MERKPLIGLILIGLILLLMQIVNPPQEIPKDLSETTTQTESSAPVANIPAAAAVGNTSSAEVKSSFSGSDAAESFTSIENDLLKLTFSNKGGRIYRAEVKNFDTAKGQPVVILDGEKNRFSYDFSLNNQLFSSQDLAFSVVNQTEQSITYRLAKDESTYIEQYYALRPNDDYIIDYDYKMVGFDDELRNGTQISLDWQQHLIQQELHLKNERDKSSIYYSEAEEIEYLNEMSDELEEETNITGLDWVSFKQQFFNFSLIAEDRDKSFKAQKLSAVAPSDKADSTLKILTANLLIEYKAAPEYVESFEMYLGPNHYQTLRDKDVGLDRVVYLGWGIFRWVNKGVIIPIFNFLNKYIGSYGLIILILTLLIKTALFPLTRKSYMSFAKMNVLKPEIAELKEKFGKDPTRMQQEQMKLYGSAGVNPIGGCIPQALQFPILIAMYNFFPSALELRQQGFLWATDLSTYDSIASLPFEIPFYGDHVSLFTLLSAASSVLFMKINSQMTPSSGAAGAQMKVMQYIMPVFLIFIFNSFSAALTYYFFLSNVISFAQQWVIKKFFIDEDKIRAEMAEKKKQPKKKGGFQQRMEKMLKEQEKKQRARQKQSGKQKGKSGKN